MEAKSRALCDAFYSQYQEIGRDPDNPFTAPDRLDQQPLPLLLTPSRVSRTDSEQFRFRTTFCALFHHRLPWVLLVYKTLRPQS